MASQRYPIGIQTFSEIIEKGYTYVDKTHYIASLTEQGKYVFLSRPRRFGKSLLVSTLEAYFQGRRELFRGLALDSMDVDWTPSPVLHFDFNAENYSVEDGLERMMDTLLTGYERIYGSEPKFVTPAQRFRYIIETAYNRTKRQVVILVDEYDKPLLLAEEQKDLIEKNQMILKSFFGNLKSMDRYIRFVFITGVARFSKVSIFSDLNNLDDISMTDGGADICGWTEEELLCSFRQGIEQLAQERKENFSLTLDALREFYDGYMFASKGSRLYNPFSVLCALRSKSIEPYWFGTGTPTFLVKRVKARGIYPPDFNGVRCTQAQLISVGMNDSNPAPLMFQTGYLTIDSYESGRGRYMLRFPNREVETGFFNDLLPVYAPETKNPDSYFSIENFKDDLYEGRPEIFMERLSSLLKTLPGEDHCESTYRAVTFLLATLCATRAVAERHIYKGRSDIEVDTGNYVYIFEFKYNKTVRQAMQQIYSRDYAGHHTVDPRPVYLIGANFDEKKDSRGLHYEIQLMQK